MNAGHQIVTAQQVAYGVIRERILEGVLRGGTLLKPNLIAEELGISRMPVREALRQLDAEGLVTLRLNRTAVVTTLTTSEIADLFDMRAALEGLTAPAVAAGVTDRVLADLERLRQAMDEARRDPREWMRCHGAFHDYLLGLCGRRRLAEEITRLRATLQPYLRLYIDVHRATDVPAHEHRTVLSALSTRDVAMIEPALKEHVLSAGRDILRFVAEHQQSTEGVGPP
jgi:DNA-binding GntR family transcriptional regulator